MVVGWESDELGFECIDQLYRFMAFFFFAFFAIFLSKYVSFSSPRGCINV